MSFIIIKTYLLRLDLKFLNVSVLIPLSILRVHSGNLHVNFMIPLTLELIVHLFLKCLASKLFKLLHFSFPSYLAIK